MTAATIKSHTIVFIISGIVFTALGWHFGYSQVKIDKQKVDILGKNPLFNLDVSNSQPTSVANADLQTFWNVWQILHTKYLDKDTLDKKKLIEGATAGMVKALNDPYSEYFGKEGTKQWDSYYTSSFEGVGLNLSYNADKQIIVESPVTDSPAERAGIQAKEKILFIGDKSTVGMNIADAASMIRGDKGTMVKLTLQKENGDFYQKELIRDTVHLRAVTSKDLTKDIALLRVNSFGDTTSKEWDEEVAKIAQKGIKKIVLDLRNNGGGYILAAQYINSDFLTGTILRTQDYAGNKVEFPATHEPHLKDTKTVVLINKGTASSSEIVSGALQEAGFKLVGENSYGKGVLQEVMPMPDDSSLHITIAKWLLPSGKWIHKVGIKPDLEVKMTESDYLNKKDPQLDKALELLKASN